MALEQQGELPEAATAWRAVIQGNPKDGGGASLAGLGVFLSKQHKYPEAAAVLFLGNSGDFAENAPETIELRSLKLKRLGTVSRWTNRRRRPLSSLRTQKFRTQSGAIACKPVVSGRGTCLTGWFPVKSQARVARLRITL